jgi:hypothetical protein
MCRDPRVAISISDQIIHITWFQLGGRVIEQISEDADEHTDRLAKKYLGMDKYPYRFPK